MKYVNTTTAPAAIGPYSQAIDSGDLVFVSGQLPIDPETETLREGIENQTLQVLKNIQAVLEAADLTLSDVVKFTIYVKSMRDFPVINEIYGSFLSLPYPSRSTVEVSKLPKDAEVEMDVIAIRKGS